jgi:hypothetical protein
LLGVPIGGGSCMNSYVRRVLCPCLSPITDVPMPKGQKNSAELQHPAAHHGPFSETAIVPPVQLQPSCVRRTEWSVQTGAAARSWSPPSVAEPSWHARGGVHDLSTKRRFASCSRWRTPHAISFNVNSRRLDKPRRRSQASNSLRPETPMRVSQNASTLKSMQPPRVACRVVVIA